MDRRYDNGYYVGGDDKMGSTEEALEMREAKINQ